MEPALAFVAQPLQLQSSELHRAVHTAAPALPGQSTISSSTPLALGVALGLGAAAVRPYGARRSPSVQQRASAKEYIEQNDIVAFVSYSCPFCQQALQGLKGAGYNVTEIEAERGSEIRGALAEMTGSTSVPKVWVKGQFVGGCNDGGLGGVMPLLRNGKIKEIMDA